MLAFGTPNFSPLQHQCHLLCPTPDLFTSVITEEVERNYQIFFAQRQYPKLTIANLVRSCAAPAHPLPGQNGEILHFPCILGFALLPQVGSFAIILLFVLLW